MIDPESPVTFAELSALLGDTEEDLRGLADGPFAPEADGTLRLRVAVGLICSAFLGCRTAIDPGLAIKAAVEAGKRCDPTDNKRLLMGWTFGRPVMGWFGDETPMPGAGTFGTAVSMPLIVIPADAMARDLAAALVAHRAADGARH